MLTLMPCLIFYWPLRLFNELIFKNGCCGGNNFDDSCQCDNDNDEIISEGKKISLFTQSN